MIRLLTGDCRDVLRTLPTASVQCVVSSPPYFGLRAYLADGHADKAKEIGAEPTPDEFVDAIVSVFNELKRVLRNDGVVFLNLGDNYARQGGQANAQTINDYKDDHRTAIAASRAPNGLKPKDLIGIPWRVAFALQADGWFLRSAMPWVKRSCLSGGTRVYARTQKGEMPMMIKDMVRLDPATVQLWNGERWTQVIDWWEAERPEVTYEIELRNGQRIGCTAEHLWPTQRGNVRADELRAVDGLWESDVIATCRLPEPSAPVLPSALDDDAVGWFIGLYIAEGWTTNDGVIGIASHTRETERFERVRRLADAFHGRCWFALKSENSCNLFVSGPVLTGLIETYVSGKMAVGKHLHPRCWGRSDRFLRAVIDGYLSGDGHWEAGNERWRLGFCNNDELVADLRTACARIGAAVRLRRVMHRLGEREFPGYRGELRFQRRERSVPGGFSAKADGEVVAVRQSRARKFWDIHVEDEPHLYALASGVLTHNCMPESATDRPGSAVEYVFMLTQRPKYFWDAEAVKMRGAIAAGTKAAKGSSARGEADGVNGRPPEYWDYTGQRNFRNSDLFYSSLGEPFGLVMDGEGTPIALDVNPEPLAEKHFAAFPSKLVRPLVLGATSAHGCCAKCGAPWTRQTKRIVHPPPDRINNNAFKHDAMTSHGEGAATLRNIVEQQTTGWSATCKCDADVAPCTVLDCFSGAGTTVMVADRLGRDAIGIDLNPKYNDMARKRLERDGGMFTSIAHA